MLPVCVGLACSQGFAIMLMLFTWIRVAACDLRIGTITATFWRSAEDLANFFVLLAMLLIMMAMAGNMLVGTHLLAYSSLQRSVNAVFALMVAGDLSSLNELVRLPTCTDKPVYRGLGYF